MPFSNSVSAVASPGRISTLFSTSNAAANPIKDKIRTIDTKHLFICLISSCIALLHQINGVSYPLSGTMNCKDKALSFI